VTLRVVGDDEKGSLKSERVKYGQEPHGTQTRERLRWQEPAAYIKDRPVLSLERAPQKTRLADRQSQCDFDFDFEETSQIAFDLRRDQSVVVSVQFGFDYSRSSNCDTEIVNKCTSVCTNERPIKEFVPIQRPTQFTRVMSHSRHVTILKIAHVCYVKHNY
jgi:hypothetical protein